MLPFFLEPAFLRLGLFPLGLQGRLFLLAFLLKLLLRRFPLAAQCRLPGLRFLRKCLGLGFRPRPFGLQGRLSFLLEQLQLQLRFFFRTQALRLSEGQGKV